MHFTSVLAITVVLLSTFIQSSESCGTFTLNASAVSRCVGEKVHIPSTWVGKCTRPFLSLTKPSGKTIFESNGKIIKVDYGNSWIVNDVQLEDGGVYINQLSCNEGKKNSPVNVKINCKTSLINSDAQKAQLYFPKPRVNGRQVNDIKITRVTTCLKNGKTFLVFEKDKFTNYAIRVLGKGMEMKLKSQMMILKNIKKEHEGNYTSIWSGEHHHVPVTATFTLIVKVQSSTNTPYTTLEPPTTGHTNSSISTGGVPRTPRQTKSGGTRITMSTLCLIANTLAGFVSAVFLYEAKY